MRKVRVLDKPERVNLMSEVFLQSYRLRKHLACYSGDAFTRAPVTLSNLHPGASQLPPRAANTAFWLIPLIGSLWDGDLTAQQKTSSGAQGGHSSAVIQ